VKLISLLRDKFAKVDDWLHGLSTSGYKGVTWHKGLKKFIAYTTLNGARKTFAGYGTVEEAAFAHDCAVAILHGEFAILNFPDLVSLTKEVQDLIRAEVSRFLSGKGDQTPYTSNTSGCHGVSYLERNRKWQVLISFEGKRVFVGCYVTKEEAVYAYICGYTSLYKKPPTVNFPLNLATEVRSAIEARVTRYIAKQTSSIDVFEGLVNPSCTNTPQSDTVNSSASQAEGVVEELESESEDLLQS